MSDSLLIVGCGYLGRRVASAWLDRGGRVAALTRSESNANEMRNSGIEPIVGDVTQPETLTLPECDALLFAVGYDRSAEPDQRAVYVDGLRNTLERLPASVRRIVYVSSTSVYGQADGAEINETSPTEPTRDSGRICLDAEELLAEWVRSQSEPPRTTVLRFAGIYGPGRLLSRVEELQRGAVLASNPDGWLNLIHVADGANAVGELLHGEEQGSAENPRLYLCCDDEPVQRRDYYGHLARLVHAPQPVFTTETDRQPDRPSRTSPESLGKRCSNRKLKAETAWRPDFPSYRAGLADAVASID